MAWLGVLLTTGGCLWAAALWCRAGRRRLALGRELLRQLALLRREILTLRRPLGEAAEALKESDTAFERWCDNRVIRTIRSQKYRAFSAGPLAAYVLARENEIKTVRMILTGKQNGLPDQAIRERVREMYV